MLSRSLGRIHAADLQRAATDVTGAAAECRVKKKNGGVDDLSAPPHPIRLLSSKSAQGDQE
jgi:hypothetical protein